MATRLKRDIFGRGMRMTQRYGPIADDDPIGARDTFRVQTPVLGEDLSSRGFGPKGQGEHRYCEPLSPIVKPNGGRKASLNGPAPDNASEIAFAIPVGTVKKKR